MGNTFFLNLKKKDATSPISNILLIFLLYLLFFRQVYSYMGMPYVPQFKGSFVYTQTSLSNTITMLTSIIALFCILFLFLNTKFFTSGTYLITSIVLIAGVCAWTFYTAGEVGVNLLYSTMPPWVYMTALMYSVGLNEKLFRIFLKHAKIIGILSVVLCIVSTLSFFVSHRGCILADSSNLRYYIQGFWLLCICSFFEEKTNKYFVCLCVVFFAVMSFSFSSRSWLIQSIIWLLSYLFFSQKNKNFSRMLKTVLLTAILAGIAFIVVQKYFPQLLEVLVEKKSPVETRAGQYYDLFAQTNIWDFIIGNGYNFTYVSSIQGGEYNYIDNAYLQMLVRYGLLIGLTYPLTFLIPVLKLKFSKHTVPLVMWLMALGGLSIFCATIIDLKSIALPVVAGRCMYYVSKKGKQLSLRNDCDNE